ncbi:diphosphomevalonate decarboxylase [Candidatus Micrarchaeota archaeon CG10_big_fil_rev_8_21_14_0_10_45_29]|nr:MAG: diphosphomevalonate decarboxylase [Candidatus Micrarchaeota archaeon CG10_big_fil_rev_8_21_14_0_10_45_29]
MEIIKTAVAAPNIALVKYWGKRDNLLKLAYNDSISITLDDSVIFTKTTVGLSEKLKKDVIIFNGKKVEDEKIAEWIELARGRVAKKAPEIAEMGMLIVTKNNFPSSAGIASSASGFAALSEAFCACAKITDAKEKSIIARLGSGSASRSVIGGFSQWVCGRRPDGEDSYAVQLAPKKHWDELVDVIAIISSAKKKISSKEGMENTAKNSPLFACRLKEVNERIGRVQKAILKKDFESLANEMMRDSNSMHATALDSWPPVFYLNDVSREIIEETHKLNERGIVAGYTFDAGPNAHIICEKKNLQKVKNMLLKVKGVKKIICAGVGGGSKIVEGENKEFAKFVKKYLPK